MTSASILINEAANSPVARLHYSLELRGPSGEPLVGKEIVVGLEGSGSLSPAFDSKQVKRETDASGSARVTWYRRAIYGRDLKATLSASSDAEGSIALEPTTAEDAGSWISHVQRKII